MLLSRQRQKDSAVMKKSLLLSLLALMLTSPTLCADDEARKTEAPKSGALKSKAEAFGKALEKADAELRGPQALAPKMDHAAFAKTVMGGVTANAEQQAKFKKALRNALGRMHQVLLGPDHYHFLRFIGGDSPRLLFRRLDDDMSVFGYLELHVALKDGQLKVVQASRNGQPITDNFRTQYRSLVKDGKQSDAFLQVYKFWGQRNAEETLKAWEKLTADEKQRLEMLQVRANALGMHKPYDNKKHLAAIEELIKQHPKSQLAQIFAIEAHIGQKQFKKAQAAVEALDKLVKDPYLHYKRGLIHGMADDWDAAKAAMSKAIELDPRLKFASQPPEPVSDPKLAAALFIGVMGGAVSPMKLDRVCDWKAMHGQSKNPQTMKMTVKQFRQAMKESVKRRPRKIKNWDLDKMMSQMTVEKKDGVAVVKAPFLGRGLTFHLTKKGWKFRG